MELVRSARPGAGGATGEDLARMQLLGRAVEWLSSNTAADAPDTAAAAYLQVRPQACLCSAAESLPQCVQVAYLIFCLRANVRDAGAMGADGRRGGAVLPGGARAHARCWRCVAAAAAAAADRQCANGKGSCVSAGAHRPRPPAWVWTGPSRCGWQRS